MQRKITAMYFSPTGTTKKVAEELAKGIAQELTGEISVARVDFTLPQGRKEPVSYSEGDLVILGVPVYAGRVPNVLLKYLDTVRGNGALGIALVLYGNRAYDDALIELKDIMESKDFKTVAACAFIGEHSFSKVLAANRPDTQDLNIVQEYAAKIAQKIENQRKLPALNVPGNKPYRPYYLPIKEDGQRVNILKVTPQTKSNCINCQICVKVCPMGSICPDDVTSMQGICIKCGACEKKCPVQAKYFTDEGYLWHKNEIEEKYSSSRKEPELYL